MKSIRFAALLACLALFGAGTTTLPVSAAEPVESGGTCYDTPSATCYLNLDGLLVRQRNARAG